MSETRQKFLCDAIAVAEADRKLFITVYQVGDGIEFSSGRGITKQGSPRRHWTNDTLKYEIAFAYGAKQVELVFPDPAAGKTSFLL